MKTEFDELKAWMQKNEEILKGRTIEEIRTLATSCGFSRGTVAMWQAGASFQAVQI